MKVNLELKRISRTISWLVIFLEIFFEYYIQRKCKRVKRWWWIILISWTILHSTVATFGLFSRTTFEYKSHLLLMAAGWAVQFFSFLLFFFSVSLLFKKACKKQVIHLVCCWFSPSTANISPVVEEEEKNTSFLNRGRHSRLICILPPSVEKTRVFYITGKKNKVPGSLCRRRLDTIWPKIRWIENWNIKKSKRKETEKKTRPLKSERIPPPGGGRMREKCLNGPIGWSVQSSLILGHLMTYAAYRRLSLSREC